MGIHQLRIRAPGGKTHSISGVCRSRSKASVLFVSQPAQVAYSKSPETTRKHPGIMQHHRLVSPTPQLCKGPMKQKTTSPHLRHLPQSSHAPVPSFIAPYQSSSFFAMAFFLASNASAKLPARLGVGVLLRD